MVSDSLQLSGAAVDPGQVGWRAAARCHERAFGLLHSTPLEQSLQGGVSAGAQTVFRTGNCMAVTQSLQSDRHTKLHSL